MKDVHENNKPPIAVAGPDQVITLPTDSVSLDGNSSSDPDGAIMNGSGQKFQALFLLISLTQCYINENYSVSGTYLFQLKSHIEKIPQTILLFGAGRSNMIKN